ncbi:MAG: TetR/AcrR family transcriptional regulator [Candidatus Schekmanbacteria bacterium]|nr:TetR/AcrR family transcriptional regulator [Candidatus Schekmanbacteria bacterium]
MPKLTPQAMERRARQIEDGALPLFRERGFHGVGLREIAAQVGISAANVYNYFPGKEEIFASVLARLYTAFCSPTEPLGQYLAQSRFPTDLEALGMAVEAMVERHRDYLCLVYVDVAELGGRHARAHYADLAGRFGALLSGRFSALRGAAGNAAEVDPAVAFSLSYMAFFNYFIVERLIGARGHLGVGDAEATRLIAEFLRRGTGSSVP